MVHMGRGNSIEVIIHLFVHLQGDIISNEICSLLSASTVAHSEKSHFPLISSGVTTSVRVNM